MMLPSVNGKNSNISKEIVSIAGRSDRSDRSEALIRLQNTPAEGRPDSAFS